MDYIHRISSCAFLLLWFSFLIPSVHCTYKITAKESHIEVHNFQTASLQWDFVFPSAQVSFVEIVSVTGTQQIKTRIAMRTNTQQFFVFANMRDRVKVNIFLCNVLYSKLNYILCRGAQRCFRYIQVHLVNPMKF